MKVLVASSSPLLRAILSEAVAAAGDLRASEPVSTLADLLERVRREPPQVVVASPALADGSLYDSMVEILRANARVLLVCDEADSGVATALLFAGATGCLLTQDADADAVVTAVRQIAAGHATLHPAVAASILTRWRDSRLDPAAMQTRPIDLTNREREVLNALARGLPTKSIGRELEVSPKTVEAHLGRLLAKLGARTRAQALAVALDRGLLKAPDSAGPNVA